MLTRAALFGNRLLTRAALFGNRLLTRAALFGNRLLTRAGLFGACAEFMLHMQQKSAVDLPTEPRP